MLWNGLFCHWSGRRRYLLTDTQCPLWCGCSWCEVVERLNTNIRGLSNSLMEKFVLAIGEVKRAS